MIRNCADRDTERLFRREVVRRWSTDLQRAALRKLLVLDAAEALDDLRIPPGNRLEKLLGDRVGQYSIRINDQWRICFRWRDDDAYDVEITDYH
ncbi:type II toxin-antitoxin system RelE/ParE family toxin [Candidatus Methylomirabilis sp.]|uniref:type II toxin-antitoxin system RelE/ParE family toxin n=1 Tax=Candidatus Methylomirabilis sp. TaxID=2032687 RepID=UPI002A6271D5|nr:type II toxin-antitoxin system RelE/ParE family toxin [Candidatus Methylomirabilis sp.]